MEKRDFEALPPGEIFEHAQDEVASISMARFLATMSHEIRSPMNGIIGYLDLLFETELTPHQNEFLLEIKKASEVLLYLINDILDYSKLEEDKVTLELIPFDLHRLVKDAVSLFVPKGREKGINIYYVISPEVPVYFLGDPVKIKQVMYNLVGNAVKFTEEGEVSVHLLLIGATGNRFKMRVEIRDTGTGIGKKEIPRIFEAFSQADVSTTRKYGGTGLGLAISRRLVALMGGEIFVQSTPMEGSVFSVEIELERSGYEAFNQMKEDIQQINNGGLSARSNRHRTYRVLLAEDKAANRKLAGAMLEHLGYEYDAVGDGIQAIWACNDVKYDVILMDCQMPVMDGYQSATVIKKSKGLNMHTPIIALTAYALQGDRDKCLAAGMDDYISKPVTMTKLNQVIEKWCNP